MDSADDHEPRRTLSSESFRAALQKLDALANDPAQQLARRVNNTLLGDPAEKAEYEAFFLPPIKNPAETQTWFLKRAGAEAERVSISNVLPRGFGTRINLPALVGPVELTGAGVVYLRPRMTLQRDPARDLTDGREAWVLLPKETP